MNYHLFVEKRRKRSETKSAKKSQAKLEAHVLGVSEWCYRCVHRDPKMGYSCYLCGEKETKESKLSFHRFPKGTSTLKENVLSQWLMACRLAVDDNVSSLRICSNHFPPTDYFTNSKLNANAVPSVNIRISKKRRHSDLEVITKSELTSVPVTEESTSSMDHGHDKENDYGKKQCTETKEEVVMEGSSTTENVHQYIFSPESRHPSEPRYISEIQISHVSTSEAASRILNFVKKVDRQKSHKIKQLQDANRRLQSKIRNLKEKMARLQQEKLVSKDAEDPLMIREEYEDDREDAETSIGTSIRYPCSKCEKEFLSKSGMKKHFRVHFDDNNLKCVICNKQFTRSSDVKRHMSTHTGIKPHACNICHANFTQKGSLAKHKRKHEETCDIVKPRTVTTDKLYLCSICGKSFKDSTSLTIHIRRHQGDKPYSCETCDMRFVTSSRLNCHKRIHTGERPFSCKLCHKSFAHSTVLNKHLKSHLEIKPYQCSFCLKAFSTSYYLNIHKRKHTGEKPLQCDICGKKFYDPKVLKQHIKTHTEEKHFLCVTCGRAFRRAHHLKIHMNSHNEKITIILTS